MGITHSASIKSINHLFKHLDDDVDGNGDSDVETHQQILRYNITTLTFTFRIDLVRRNLSRANQNGFNQWRSLLCWNHDLGSGLNGLSLCVHFNGALRLNQLLEDTAAHGLTQDSSSTNPQAQMPVPAQVLWNHQGLSGSCGLTARTLPVRCLTWDFQSHWETQAGCGSPWRQKQSTGENDEWMLMMIDGWLTSETLKKRFKHEMPLLGQPEVNAEASWCWQSLYVLLYQ